MHATPEQMLADIFRMKLALGFILDIVGYYNEMLGGDTTRAIILLAATRASSRHLRRPDRADPSGFLEDSLRKSTTAAALARSLSLPAETVRRHLIALESDGYVTRTANGEFIVLVENLTRANIMKAVMSGLTSYRILRRELKEDLRAELMDGGRDRD